jgi:superfamily I DNA/RNA helicase
MRLALKLETGAGKTTVMAMLIAWQTVNAVRSPNSKRFTHGNTETRSHTVSVFNCPPPDVQVLKNEKEETNAVSRWLTERIKEGIRPDEIGVFVRSAAQLARAQAAVAAAKLSHQMLDENVEPTSGLVSISTMHLAKGLEFRAVVVMACNDAVIPLQERIETVADETDLEEVYNTERHLLYVACTRARDYLLVTSAGSTSEFLDGLSTG